MDILFDLHTHTTYSHGKGSVFENVAVAEQKGILLGIADHGAGHFFYGVSESAFEKERLDVLDVNAKHKKQIALLGVEANLTGHGQTDRHRYGPVDFVLMGFHKGVFASSFFTSLFAAKLFSKNRASTMMTDALIAALQDGTVDAITHPGVYCPIYMRPLAQAARECGVALEINASHAPNIPDLRTALDCGAYFLVSSDAHTPQNVGNVRAALEAAAAADIPSKRIVNSAAYAFDASLRLDKLSKWSQSI